MIDRLQVAQAILDQNATDGAKQEAGRLVDGWLDHPDFRDSDQSMKWLHVEPEMLWWIDEDTLLVGRVDAIGLNEEGTPFFGEWKTSRYKKEWKYDWKMSVQALTYGLLGKYGRLYEGDPKGGAKLDSPLEQFLVRVAFKTSPPKYDYAWFEFSEEEMEFWKHQVQAIASRIRWERSSDYLEAVDETFAGWQTNIDHCFRYGPNYPCPYFEHGCSKVVFLTTPQHGDVYQKRVPHLRVERELLDSLPPNPNLVVLDATRIETFLNCQERYRMGYEVGLQGEAGVALQTGTCFHSGLKVYYEQLAKS